jgi:GntR family transcriptional regulator
MTVPLTYRHIADDIQARIEAGEYPPGSAIPSYRELSRIYTVSMATAQRAVRVLRERGVARGMRGRGVFVTQE